jgi:hypothetical protein
VLSQSGGDRKSTNQDTGFRVKVLTRDLLIAEPVWW